MNIKKLAAIGIVSVAASAMALDYVEVIDVAARQRYPWNGLVDIDFELDSRATEPYMMKVTVLDNVGKTNLPVRTVYTENVSQKDNPCMVTKDTTRIVWDAAADLPDGFKCTNVLVTCQDTRTIDDDKRYMIIDLSGGSSASSYPVSYMSTPPVGGWTDKYKLTKLVLRRVEAGTFMMGSPTDEVGRYANEDYHKVTLTKSFYIGVFEVTEKQWSSVVSGSSGSSKKPRLVSYAATRGSQTIRPSNTLWSESNWCWPNSSAVDPSSFCGKLRSKCSGLLFDLPTEAQWELAARGGCVKALNIGYDYSVARLNQSGRNINNADDGLGDASSSTVTFVGCYMPNALGLYDMIGNAAEWCVDAYKKNLGTTSVTDPKGAAVNITSPTPSDPSAYRVMRGGGYVSNAGNYALTGDVWGWNKGFSPAKACRSAGRISNRAENAGDNVLCGFRVCCLMN